MTTLHDLGALGPLGPEGHGTRKSYAAGCRCVPCRSAEACYRAQWEQRRADGLTGWVDASPARAHLEHLQRAGVGLKHAAKHAGVAFATVQGIRSGTRSRIQLGVSVKILQLKPIPALGATVNSYRTRHLMRCLLAEGYDRATIATALGLHVATVAFHHARIRVKTAVKIRALWRRWTME